jgi:hypothetical protein
VNQQEELLERLSRIDVEKAVAEYLQDKLGKQMRYNLEAFSAENIYDSKKFWNTGIVKKPTLLDLEKYYKLALEREYREDAQRCWKQLRELRDKKLKETDWTQYVDVPMDTKDRVRYREYRQYLRDRTRNYTNDTIKDYSIIEFEEWRIRMYPEDYHL